MCSRFFLRKVFTEKVRECVLVSFFVKYLPRKLGNVFSFLSS